MVTTRTQVVTTRTQELIKKDLAHLFHGLGRVGLAPEIIWERGKGAQLWDTEGKQYTDMSSGGVHCVSLGFGRKELIDAAYEEMQKISYVSSHWPQSNIQAIEYAAELAEVLPGDINHVYLTNTGTESVEVAIQIARMYWDTHGQVEKYKIICLDRAYHGGSALTRSLTGSHVGLPCSGRAYPGVVRIPNYHCHLCSFGLKYPACDMVCARFVERVIEQEGAGIISCMIAEVAQGSGGVIWPPDEYWPIVRRICSDHNILLIADEVQTGFCKTGKFWGLQHWNVIPDIMAMAKGINSSYLPFGAVGFSDKVYNGLPHGKPFRGYTTCATNPPCVATARAALKIYIKEKLTERAANLGEHLRDRLIKEFLPLPCVDDVLGSGLYYSFEIALNKTTGSAFNLEAAIKARESILSQCQEKGVYLTRLDGYPRRQPIVPPLIITEEELDTALDVIFSVMKEVKPV